jgi:small ubiquitin-related modifier
MFDGSIRLRGEKTAAEFDLEDGDSIDFFETQVGGVR